MNGLYFIFGIGQTVVHRSFLVEPVPPDAVRMTVTEQISQTCAGGTQKLYLCRLMSVDRVSSMLGHALVSFNEVELAPWEEYIRLATLASEQARVQQEADDQARRARWRAVAAETTTPEAG